MLIKGYQRERFEKEVRQEQVFAVYPDGRVYQSKWGAWSPDFWKWRNGHKREWQQIEALPSGARFCGNYESIS